jgi:hypothetical protein
MRDAASRIMGRNGREMSDRCGAFCSDLNGATQQCVLRGGHSGMHQDIDGIEFDELDAESLQDLSLRAGHNEHLNPQRRV